MEPESGLLSVPAMLLYWIKERHKIFLRKEEGFPRPWSDDPVFQKTYFCNVQRENDKVTRWIRRQYSPHVDHPLFEYNMVLARFLNRPHTLGEIGFMEKHDPDYIEHTIHELTKSGIPVWGGAYVITTHGQKMPKATYLCHDVLEQVYTAQEALISACRGVGPPPTLARASRALQRIEGIGSFLAGQIVADLKNTKGHPLEKAEDWWTFVEPGPGSVRGASWFHYGTPSDVSTSNFHDHFALIRKWFDTEWVKDKSFPYLCNQDLQNCLCEFDKYMRVKTGSGRSKRGYNGV